MNHAKKPAKRKVNKDCKNESKDHKSKTNLNPLRAKSSKKIVSAQDQIKRQRCHTSIEIRDERRPLHSHKKNKINRSCTQEDFIEKFQDIEIKLCDLKEKSKDKQRRQVRSVVQQKSQRPLGKLKSKGKKSKQQLPHHRKVESQQFYIPKRDQTFKDFAFSKVAIKYDFKQLVHSSSSNQLPASVLQSKKSSIVPSRDDDICLVSQLLPQQSRPSKLNEARMQQIAALKIQNFFKKVMTRKMLERNLLRDQSLQQRSQRHDLMIVQNDQEIKTFRTINNNQQFNSSSQNNPYHTIESEEQDLIEQDPEDQSEEQDPEKEEDFDSQCFYRLSNSIIHETHQQYLQSRKSSLMPSGPQPSSLNSTIKDKKDIIKKYSVNSDGIPQAFDQSVDDDIQVRQLDSIQMINIARRNYRPVDEPYSSDYSNQRSSQKLKQEENPIQKLNTIQSKQSKSEQSSVYTNMLKLLQNSRTSQNSKLVDQLIQTLKLEKEKEAQSGSLASQKPSSLPSQAVSGHSSVESDYSEVPIYNVQPPPVSRKFQQKTKPFKEKLNIQLQSNAEEYINFHRNFLQNLDKEYKFSQKVPQRRSKQQIIEALKNRIPGKFQQHEQVRVYMEQNKRLLQLREQRQIYNLECKFMQDKISDQHLRMQNQLISRKYKNKADKITSILNNIQQSYRLLQAQDLEMRQNYSKLALQNSLVFSSDIIPLRRAFSDGKLKFKLQRITSTKIDSPRQDLLQDAFLKLGTQVSKKKTTEIQGLGNNVIISRDLIGPSTKVDFLDSRKTNNVSDERLVNFLLEHLLKELVLQIYFSSIFTVYENMERFEPVIIPPLNIEPCHLINYIDQIDSVYPERLVLLAKINQQMTPVPLQLMKILRSQQVEESQFQLLLSHDVFLRSCELMPKILTVEPSKVEWNIHKFNSSQFKVFKERAKIINQLKQNARKTSTDMQNVYYKAVFDAFNQLIVDAKCSYCVKRQQSRKSMIQLAFSDLNLQIDQHKMDWIIEYSNSFLRTTVSNQLRPQIQDLHGDFSVFVMELENSKHRQIQEENQKKEMLHLKMELQLNECKWTNYSDQVLDLFVTVAGLLDKELISETAQQLFQLIKRR